MLDWEWEKIDLLFLELKEMLVSIECGERRKRNTFVQILDYRNGDDLYLSSVHAKIENEMCKKYKQLDKFNMLCTFN
jgi:hypothetical protein